jgi:hypothetical protein
VRPEGLGKFKNSPNRESNPRPSGLSRMCTLYNSVLPKVNAMKDLALTEGFEKHSSLDSWQEL